jgi:hypothetical protein
VFSGRFTLSRGEVAKLIFGRSYQWLSIKEATPLVLPSGLTWSAAFSNGRRVYTLDDIHSLATALVFRGDLDPRRFDRIIKLIEDMSEVWEG